VQCPPPTIGADTKKGLHDWGFSEEEVETLLAKGVVGWQG
jgi:crotonobetainyl-CoA:carnitine CoA-transferase CaiB-like acyl-CoA transferase